MFFFPLLLSPLLHHTIPAGANLRLTVYRCITRLHLSNLRPRLPPSPREGAADQEKGRNGWRSEGAKERSVSVSQRIGLCLSKSGSENVTAGEAEQRHLFSVCVCVCVRVCVCMDLVELRCHICEDHSFKLVATRDDAPNHWNARDDCAVICCVNACVCLWGRLMEINTTFLKVKMLSSMSPWNKSEWHCLVWALM